MTTKYQSLIARLAAAEEHLLSTKIVAPALPGTKLRARLEGLVYELRVTPKSFAGWGVFTAVDTKSVHLVERAPFAVVQKYLAQLMPARLVVLRRLKKQSWLAWPANAESFRKRRVKPPVVVHLCEGIAPFEVVRARFDGASFWFEGVDHGSDPVTADALRLAERRDEPAVELRIPGLTPDVREAYGWLRAYVAEKARRDRERTLRGRLENALHVGGGELETYRERGDVLTVHWRDRHGVEHASAIDRRALGVQMAGGVCLGGRDGDFDLTSLVGVLTDAPTWARH